MNVSNPSGALSQIFSALKTIVTVVVALAGLGLFLGWMGGAFHEKVAPGVVPLEKRSASGRTLVTAEKTFEDDTITAVGSVQPRKKTEVSSQLLATIQEIKFRPSNRVKSGDVLIVLDNRELLAQQREAMASLAASEADLVTRRTDYERVKMLRATGSASMEELTRLEGAYRVTAAQVMRAKEMISRIEVQLSHTRILATADGVVADRQAEPGDLASPGKPILSIYDPQDMELHANVPESLATGLTLEQLVAVRIDANHLAANARIREIVPQAQQASRSVLVKLELPRVSVNPNLPGMFGRALVPVGRAERLLLPSEAVTRLGQLDLVEVADQSGMLSRRFVRIGKETEGKAEILSGLSGGEKVALPARK